MNSSPQLARAFERARALLRAGRFSEAEQAYRQLAGTRDAREPALLALAELYLQARQPGKAADLFVTLTDEAPDALYYCARLASLLESLGQIDAAIGRYQRFIARQPASASAHFNLALLYKSNKQFAEALAAYEAAIRLGIERVQEVYSNMGVLHSEMRAGDKAAEMYERALAIDPTYLPALFNRATLFEERGERERAIEVYRRILSLDPGQWESLCRLVYARTVASDAAEWLGKLESALASTRTDPAAQEGLYFALGKALDDLGRYDEAFAAYRSANALGRQRNPPYDRSRIERTFDRLIELFAANRLNDLGTRSTASPIFICGMLRSGSTLVEQILAAHPAVTAGGELDLLSWLAARKLAPYPERVADVSRSDLEQLGAEYLARVRELYPQGAHVTDKRPDNFRYLGLVRLVFPAARIVYTRRHRLDTCLSIYFQQLGAHAAYATDLGDTAHYHAQHERLMNHWMRSFGANICTVDYDELVRTPEPVVRRLLEFLGLAWDERCLRFQDTAGLVKTASVWQVRGDLHARSSGRWRHYEHFVRDIQQPGDARA